MKLTYHTPEHFSTQFIPRHYPKPNATDKDLILTWLDDKNFPTPTAQERYYDDFDDPNRGKDHVQTMMLAAGTTIAVIYEPDLETMITLDKPTTVLIPWAGFGLTSDAYIVFLDDDGACFVAGEPGEMNTKSELEEIGYKGPKATHYIRTM